MAGIQSCFRKYLILNSSRLINKNGILLQSCRGRHHLVCQLSSPQYRTVFHTIKFCSVNRQFSFRLASTDVTVPAESVLDIFKNAAVTEAVPVKTVPQQHAEQHAQQHAQQNVQQNAQQHVQQNAQQPTSTEAAVVDESTLPPAPELEVTEPPDMEFISMGLKEPSFESLGLGSWWPSGIIQQIFEYLHINLELPWWQAIALVTIVTRILLAPVSLKGKKEGINMMNNFPQIHKYQEKINAAKLRGDYYAVAAQTQELHNFLKSGKINMFGFVRTAMIQGPIFLSMYYALNGMAKAPVESLKTEGLFWFQDLTVQDPYYILPVVLSSTLLVILETGAEGNPASVNSRTTKWVLRIFPVFALMFTANCSSCIAWYWTISNAITLFQASMYKVPAVKKILKIPDAIPPPVKQKTSKGFIEDFKEGFDNMKITHQIQERERMNMLAFQKSGSGPTPRTFKKNPLLEKAK